MIMEFLKDLNNISGECKDYLKGRRSTNSAFGKVQNLLQN